MADFVGLLKKTIDAQSNAMPELRQRIYARARLTVEKKLAESHITPETAALQRMIVEKAIREVEDFYSVVAREAEQHRPDDKHVGVQELPVQQQARMPEFAIAREITPRTMLAEREQVGRNAPATGENALQMPRASGAMFALPEPEEARDSSGLVSEDELPPVDESLPGRSVIGAKAAAVPENIRNSFRPLFAPLTRCSSGYEAAVSLRGEKTGPVAKPIESRPGETAAILPESQADAGYEPFSAAFVQEREGNGAAGLSVTTAAGDSHYDSIPDFLSYPESGQENALQVYSGQSKDGDEIQAASWEAVTCPVAVVSDIPPSSAIAIRRENAEPIAYKADESKQIALAYPAATPQLPIPQAFTRLQHLETGFPMQDIAAFARAGENAPYAEKSLPENRSGDFDLVSDIFAQAAMREKKRSGKRRLLLAGGIIVVILSIGVAIVWFLTGFLQKKDAPQTAAAVEVRDQAPIQEQAGQTQTAKLTQRLLPDGRETNPGPAAGLAATGNQADQIIPAKPPLVGEARFYESRTSILPETSQTGTAEWTLLHETSESGGEEMAIRGEVQIPDKDLKLLITIRRNADASIPAAYLEELVFVVPENFDGGAIDKVGQLMFKPSEQSAVQDLQGTIVPIRINDNFFLVTMNAPRPFLEQNLSIMRQLPWIKLNVQYKNGRYGEFSIAKGERGDAIFKQVIDNWRAKGNSKPYNKPASVQREERGMEQAAP